MDSNHRPHAYQACALTSWAIGPQLFSSQAFLLFLILASSVQLLTLSKRLSLSAQFIDWESLSFENDIFKSQAFCFPLFNWTLWWAFKTKCNMSPLFHFHLLRRCSVLFQSNVFTLSHFSLSVQSLTLSKLLTLSLQFVDWETFSLKS